MQQYDSIAYQSWQLFQEFSDVVAKHLSIIFEKFEKSGEILYDWKKKKYCSCFRKLQKCDPENYECVLQNIMEQILIETLLRPMRNKEMIQGSTRGKSCLINLVAF